MSQQGPILVVSTARRPSFAATLDDRQAVSGGRDRVGGRGARRRAGAAGRRAGRNLRHRCSRTGGAGSAGCGTPALSAADRGRSRRSRFRTTPFPSFRPDLQRTAAPTVWWRACAPRCACGRLHATVMRRLVPATPMALSHIDPARDATVLLIGRGGAYPDAVGRAWRAHRRGRRALDRGGGEASQHPRHRRHRARRRFQPARGRRLPHRADGGRPLPQPSRRRDGGRSGAGLRSAEPRNRLRRRRPGGRDRAAADPPACLRSASEPHAEGRSTPMA